ncbi:BLUF domain-containing protein [Hymenobacter sp. NST-14]|uniref:BLUF domain-containing protein n=1 Tax=Hymenobacter piscis TaxID=2839984 RepID=UPI001C016D27|nr:BLUF domain-containing protein [Hymenobacter piscis]MBT9391972.1 BLUF domain-containing protein [Hymenobacter piscis]
MPASSVPLFRLVYHSQATHLLRPAALTALLEKARAHNQGQWLTGLLLYAENQFMQVLEGPEPALTALYAKIKVDPRHREVQTLHFAPVERRAFPDWRMGFARPSPEKFRQATGFLNLAATPGLAAHPPRELWEQLREFAQSEQVSR